MESTFYVWLYEHITRYKEINCVDLTYHKFRYKRKEYTQLELMDNILERIEFYFTSEYQYKDNVKMPEKLANNKYYLKYGYHDSWNEEHLEITCEIAKIWAIILPAMWW